MSRIRSLKPEHKVHHKVGPLSDRAYRLWVGMLTEADDYGILVGEPAKLRAQVFAYHDVTLDQVSAALDEIARVGLVQVYAVNGTRYVAFPGWTDHQKVVHPGKARLPAPPEDSREPPEDSRDPLEDVRDSLKSSPTIKDQGSGIKDQGSSPPTPPQPGGLAPSEVSPNGRRPYRQESEDLLAFLNQHAGKHFRPGKATTGFIEARLKAGASVLECRAVIIRHCREWKGDKKTETWLRPKTLFNETNFAQYLGDIPERKEPPDA